MPSGSTRTGTSNWRTDTLVLAPGVLQEVTGIPHSAGRESGPLVGRRLLSIWGPVLERWVVTNDGVVVRFAESALGPDDEVGLVPMHFDHPEDLFPSELFVPYVWTEELYRLNQATFEIDLEGSESVGRAYVHAVPVPEPTQLLGWLSACAGLLAWHALYERRPVAYESKAFGGNSRGPGRS